MIEQCANILTQANASKMQLTISVLNGNVTVIANTMLNPTTQGESTDALKLRAALTQPLIIKGDIGEIDVSITDALIQYTDTYVSGANAHSNLLDTKANVEKATKSASKKSPSKAVKPEQTQTQEEQTPSDVVESASEPKMATQEISPDNFMFDDVDSL